MLLFNTNAKHYVEYSIMQSTLKKLILSQSKPVHLLRGGNEKEQ